MCDLDVGASDEEGLRAEDLANPWRPLVEVLNDLGILGAGSMFPKNYYNNQLEAWVASSLQV